MNLRTLNVLNLKNVVKPVPDLEDRFMRNQEPPWLTDMVITFKPLKKLNKRGDFFSKNTFYRT